MRRQPQSRVHHHRHAALLDDDLQRRPRPDPLVRPDGAAQRHDRRGAAVLQPPGENRIGVDVGKHDEALGHQRLGRPKRFDRVRQQVVRIGRHLQLDPVDPGGRPRQARQADRLVGRPGPGRVGQKLIATAVDLAQRVVARVVDVHAAKRHRHDLGARGVQRLRHDLRRGKLARSHQQTRIELPAGNA